MAASNPILTPDRGKAHSVALGVLCALAMVQVSAMIRAVWLAKSKSIIPAVTAQDQNTQPVGTPPLSPRVPVASALMTPPSVPVVTSSVTSVKSTAVVAATSVPPLDAQMQELIELARQLRPLGDLKGALDVLRRADTKSPDHPAVLAEFAKTYEQMGLGDKAAAARQKLAAMGARSGSAPAPASRSTSLSPATGLTTPESRSLDFSKILGIGTCEVIRDRSMKRGEKITLRLLIRSQPGQVIDPSAIDIDVFFFDLVNGEKIEQTKADVPVNTWVDAPVDWKNGQERLDVVYSMPEMTTEVIHSIGLRKFHGYIVKLYYQHKLQDTVMEPASLQNIGAGSAPQSAGNPLLPPVAR